MAKKQKASDPYLGSGMAEKAKNTIKEHRQKQSKELSNIQKMLRKMR